MRGKILGGTAVVLAVGACAVSFTDYPPGLGGGGGATSASSTSSTIGTGNTSTGGSTTHSTTVSSSSSSTSGAGGTTTTTTATSTDPVCISTAMSVSNACINCINGLLNTKPPCIQTFVTQCEANTGCLAYVLCESTCLNNAPDAGASGAGGGGTACVAGEATGDAGSPENNCLACCQNGNMAGANTFVTDLINACVCAAGAPCASQCAM